MTPLVIIPARKGSVRVPRKNVRRVYGQSLLERAIDIGTQIGDVVVTTDDPVAKAQAARKNVIVHNRPRSLATRTATMGGVIVDALSYCHGNPCDCWVLLQPTTPTRSVAEVRRVLAAIPPIYNTIVATATPIDRHGVRYHGEPASSLVWPEALSLWRLNGAAYAGTLVPLSTTDATWYDIVESRHPHINVDTPADWKAWVALRKREVGR